MLKIQGNSTRRGLATASDKSLSPVTTFANKKGKREGKRSREREERKGKEGVREAEERGEEWGKRGKCIGNVYNHRNKRDNIHSICRKAKNTQG